MAGEAAIAVDEGVEVLACLVGFSVEALVAGGHSDAPFEALLLQEREEGFEVVPVGGDLTVRRQEVHASLEVRQIRDDKAVGTFDGAENSNVISLAAPWLTFLTTMLISGRLS